MNDIYQFTINNYSENIRLQQVADIACMTPQAFCRYFKRQTKITFTDFVNQYRITQAKTLLLKDISVSETCYEVGFESLSYFNKLFKKLTGLNPSVFKKQILSR